MILEGDKDHKLSGSRIQTKANLGNWGCAAFVKISDA